MHQTEQQFWTRLLWFLFLSNPLCYGSLNSNPVAGWCIITPWNGLQGCVICPGGVAGPRTMLANYQLDCTCRENLSNPSQSHCNSIPKKTSNKWLYISRPPAFTLWHLAPSDQQSVSAVFPPVVGSNPIPSGDGRINTSLVICVAYVLTLDRDQLSVGPSRSDQPPPALHSTWVPSEARGWGDHEEDTGWATESIRRL